MPGTTPAAAGAADSGAGAPHNSMTNARKALSVSRWPDRATGIRALYRTKSDGPRSVRRGPFSLAAGTEFKPANSGLRVELCCGSELSGFSYVQGSGCKVLRTASPGCASGKTSCGWHKDAGKQTRRRRSQCVGTILCLRWATSSDKQAVDSDRRSRTCGHYNASCGPVARRSLCFRLASRSGGKRVADSRRLARYPLGRVRDGRPYTNHFRLQ
jgi:hypothetical protein